ncbi:efflux RND transporter periplasmic adaptor subunit [Algoriphagus terrigena]|uniref:efflux RND transporter periplasmic adaptor subunit n=1 Tax=Algoriphagus terrigena TaxID=344884 RepID=UPI0003F855F4|nr:efflux RND transporter periplasmic adaptor subunit [Algoriphagus terrigena]
MNIPKIYEGSVLKLISLAWTPILLMTAVGCDSNPEGAKATEAVAEKEHEAFVLNLDTLSSTFRIPGELIAYQQVDLYAKVSSFVERLTVDVGSEVKKGQILATLEAPEISSQLAGAESRLKSFEAIYLASKARYDRLKRTSETPGTVSENDLEMAFANQQSDLANWESAKAAFREITDTKAYLEIRAPFSGVITARNVSPGAYVGPSGRGSEFPLFTLQELDKLRLVVNVPELYAANLMKDNSVSFTVQSIPGRDFTAQVSRLAGALDDRLRSERIEMDVPNPKSELLPGMVAEVTLPIQSSGASFIVPSSSILSSTTGNFVIRKKDGKAEWIAINNGRRDLTSAEVFGELTKGDTLLVFPNEEIRHGQAVKVKLGE